MSRTVNSRLTYADLLRVAAILAVIVVHVSTSQLTSVPVDSTAFRVLTVYDGLAHWCVPVFFMLSGMFLLDPKRSLTTSRLLLHHMLRIFLALVVWAVIYALVGILLAGGTLSWASAGDALRNALRGKTHYHLWFLYTILGLYLVTPILRAFLRGASRSDVHWFLLLSFLFASVIPTLLRLRPSQAVSTYLLNLNLHLVLGYVGYYVLGYYLKTYTLSRPVEYLIYLLGILGGAVTVGGTLLRSRRMGQLAQLYLNYDSPNLVFLSVAVFVLFRYVLGVSEERSRRSRVSDVAQITFGIYLVHDLFFSLLLHFGITPLSFNPILSVPIFTAGIFLCSFAAAWLLSKIPLLGRIFT